MKHTNAQIAANLNLWNEDYNTSALMTEEEDTMSRAAEEALGILCMYRGDLIPERAWTESLTGTVANRWYDMVLADDYINIIENNDLDRITVTVTPISTGEALEIWREVRTHSVAPDAPDVDEWILIRIRSQEATVMLVSELIVPANGW